MTRGVTRGCVHVCMGGGGGSDSTQNTGIQSGSMTWGDVLICGMWGRRSDSSEKRGASGRICFHPCYLICFLLPHALPLAPAPLLSLPATLFSPLPSLPAPLTHFRSSSHKDLPALSPPQTGPSPGCVLLMQIALSNLIFSFFLNLSLSTFIFLPSPLHLTASDGSWSGLLQLFVPGLSSCFFSRACGGQIRHRRAGSLSRVRTCVHSCADLQRPATAARGSHTAAVA
jgi:hypothetical protein